MKYSVKAVYVAQNSEQDSYVCYAFTGRGRQDRRNVIYGFGDTPVEAIKAFCVYSKEQEIEWETQGQPTVGSLNIRPWQDEGETYDRLARQEQERLAYHASKERTVSWFVKSLKTKKGQTRAEVANADWVF